MPDGGPARGRPAGRVRRRRDQRRRAAACRLPDLRRASHEGLRRKEYEYIHSKGLLLQLDCPDLAMERVGLFQKEPLSRFLEAVEAHVEAINRALVNIPRESVRLHVCWGNWDGPHVYDVSLEDIL